MMKYLVTGKSCGMTSEPDQLMEQIMNSCFQSTYEGEPKMPRVDIREKGDRYLLEAELPGYSENDVALRVEENLLILEASREKEEKEEEREKYLMRERSAVSYKRSFVIPKSVDPSQISASMKNGILFLELKKSEAIKPRTIKIKAP